MNSLILIFLLLFLAGMTGIYLANRTKSPNPADDIENIQSEASFSIKKIHHKATKNGVKQWDLTADKADYYKDKNEIRFHQIHALFFLENKDEINLTANQSTLNTETNDMDISGKIIAISENGTLKTETLQYMDNQHIIIGNSPVELSGATFLINADKMVLSLDTKRTEFLGNVNGEFIEGRE